MDGMGLDDSTLLNIAGRWLHALTEGSGDVVTLVDAEGRVQFSSSGPSVQALCGLSGADLARARPRDLVHPEDRDRAAAAFRRLVTQPGARESAELRLRHRDGRWVTCRAHGYNRLDDAVVRAVVIHTCPAATPEVTTPPSDVAPSTRARSTFVEAVSRAISRAAAEERFGFSVLLVELQNYKQLLGTYGAGVVDEVQLEAFRRLEALIGPRDVLAFLGGGEFGVLMHGPPDLAVAQKFAERIQASIALRFPVRDVVITSAAFVGIATSERAYTRGEQVIDDAAVALNRARAPSSRRRAVFQTAMRMEDTRAMAILGGLHTALAANQLRVHYQPILRLATQELVGFEALVRWQHPTQGLVPPGSFIPVAEESGLIVPIGNFVLHEACRQMAEWNVAYRGTAPLFVSVNVSGRQFADDDIAVNVTSALQKSSLEPGQLKLEITESSVIEQQASAAAVLNRVKSLGVRLALDDFGTGSSSFSYLHQLPYDTLKIDRQSHGGSRRQLVRVELGQGPLPRFPTVVRAEQPSIARRKPRSRRIPISATRRR